MRRWIPGFRTVWNLPKRSTMTAPFSGTIFMPMLGGRGATARSLSEVL